MRRCPDLVSDSLAPRRQAYTSRADPPTQGRPWRTASPYDGRPDAVGVPVDEGCPSYLSMPSISEARGAGAGPEEAEGTGGAEDAPAERTEGLLRSRKAVLPSEVRRRERSQDGRVRSLPDEETPPGGEVRHSRAREPQHRRDAVAVAPPRRGREAASPGLKPLTRCTSDSGFSRLPSSLKTPHPGLDTVACEGGMANGEICPPEPTVSVAQLRHSYLESTGAIRRPEPEL